MRQAIGGAARLVHHLVHAVAHPRQRLVGEIQLARRSGRGCSSPPTECTSRGRDRLAAGDARRLLRQLQRRGGDIALADADAERVALLPGLLVGLLLPGADWDQAGMLARQFDAGERAQAQLARRLLDLVDAQRGARFHRRRRRSCS